MRVFFRIVNILFRSWDITIKRCVPSQLWTDMHKSRHGSKNGCITKNLQFCKISSILQKIKSLILQKIFGWTRCIVPLYSAAGWRGRRGWWTWPRARSSWVDPPPSRVRTPTMTTSSAPAPSWWTSRLPGVTSTSSDVCSGIYGNQRGNITHYNSNSAATNQTITATSTECNFLFLFLYKNSYVTLVI